MSKHMKLFFTLSVVLNIILLGVMAGGTFHAYNKHNRHFDSKFGGLSPEVKGKLKESFRESREEFHAFMEEGKAAREQLKDSMNGTEFDPALYDEASGKLNDLRYKMMQHKAARTKAIIQDLPADERRQILGYLLRGGMDGFHRGGRRVSYKKEFKQNKQEQDKTESIRAPQPAGVEEGNNILTPIPD